MRKKSIFAHLFGARPLVTIHMAFGKIAAGITSGRGYIAGAATKRLELQFCIGCPYNPFVITRLDHVMGQRTKNVRFHFLNNSDDLGLCVAIPRFSIRVMYDRTGRGLWE